MNLQGVNVAFQGLATLENAVDQYSEVLPSTSQSQTQAKIFFMKRFDPTKIGNPQRPGENSVEGDPTWADSHHGISQFVDQTNDKSVGFWDNDHGSYFYGLGYLRVCPRTGKHTFVLNPEMQPFKEKKR
jgi:hypothetical protein